MHKRYNSIKKSANKKGYLKMQSVDEFIEQLLIEKGITDLEPDIQNELKEDMKTRLLNQINRAAVLELSEEKANELAALVEDPNFGEKEMSEFMKNSGVDLTTIVADTMLRFRSFYLGAGA